jgi:formylglycine-generating enzyme required for sulfatase activity
MADERQDTAKPAHDWLNYSQYAQPLWRRMHNELNHSTRGRGTAAGRLPTGDPLVVGVYGEWGAGKTKLLELVYELAAEAAAQTLAQRALDPKGYDTELCVTVPVWFHPWKYEHEDSLVVPLLMHITQALTEHLKHGHSTMERALVLMDEAEDKKKELVAGFAAAKAAFEATAHGLHGAVTNKWVKTVVGVAAGMVGLGTVAEEGLKRVEEATRGLTDEVSEDADEGAAKAASKPKPDPLATVPRVTADGSHYYALHQRLAKLTHITAVLAKELGLQIAGGGVRIQFAVFIDDLDRCLPEKAVQVLEIIKTVLNTEHFAFMVALDDEVIERGIAHRYRDYRFKGAKPEMPITGFEYLEKIVHLPFKLPQLTRAQGREFIRKLEDHLVEITAEGLRAGAAGKDAAPVEVPRLWFTAQAGLRGMEGGLAGKGALDVGLSDSTNDEDSNTASKPVELLPTPLVDMLLNAFTAPVPRKLARAVEFMHQWQQVMCLRGTPLHAGQGSGGSAADARIFLALGMLQLFAPELYRLIRRRPLIWRQWLTSYVSEKTAVRPAFDWRMDPQALELNVSDELILRWVMDGEEAGLPVPSSAQIAGAGAVAPAAAAAPPTATPSASVARLAVPWGGDWPQWLLDFGKQPLGPGHRYTAEQERLPWARALLEYRSVGRHLFDPLRLGAALAHTMGWSTPGAVPFVAGYFELFTAASIGVTANVVMEGRPVVSALVNAAAAGDGPAPAGGSPAPIHWAEVSSQLLVDLLTSADAGTRRSAVERLNLPTGSTIRPDAMQLLLRALNAMLPADRLTTLQALLPLAAHLHTESKQAVGALGFAYDQTPQWLALGKPDSPEAFDAARLASEIAAAGLIDDLQMETVRRSAQTCVLNILENPSIPLERRAEAADWLAHLGDPRYEFKGPLWLPTVRDTTAQLPDGMAREQFEPIPGFVRVPAGRSAVGSAQDSDNPPGFVLFPHDFYIARTLTTVAQWRAFMGEGQANASGYSDKALWDEEGWQWIEGRWDSTVKDETYQRWLKARTPGEQRRQPRGWAEQAAFGNRPVTGVSWFEARAYARWLSAQLAPQLTGALKGYAVTLPTEDQWERAAKADAWQTVGHTRWPLPWGDEEANAHRYANVDGNKLGRPNAVGLFECNPLGLADMAGNVWEWQDNLYQPRPSGTAVQGALKGVARALGIANDTVDGKAPMATYARVAKEAAPKRGADLKDTDRPALRGGSWLHSTEGARCAYRLGGRPDGSDPDTGVRVVLSLPILKS